MKIKALEIQYAGQFSEPLRQLAGRMYVLGRELHLLIVLHTGSQGFAAGAAS